MGVANAIKTTAAMTPGRRRIRLLAVVLPLLFACAPPSSTEEFIKVRDARNGIYSFKVDMSDSLAVYDLSFYTRVDRNSLTSSGEAPRIRLVATWISPSGETFSETVYLPSGDAEGMVRKYRSGVQPKEPGVWTLNVKAYSQEKGFRGLGLICDRNGTR